MVKLSTVGEKNIITPNDIFPHFYLSRGKVVVQADNLTYLDIFI